MAESHPDKGKNSGRERLIQAAGSLTHTTLFDDITIDEIVKEAELSRPAFYYHFPGGKEELRAELVRAGLISDTPMQDTRQVIMDAALRVFARSGASGTTLDDIATEAGVSRGALCWHFHNKNDLLAAVIEQTTPFIALRQAIEQIEQELQSGAKLDDETVLRRIAGGFYDSTAQSAIMRLTILLIHTHPEAAHMLADKIMKGRQSITNYIKQRQEEGEFRQDIDAALFVQILAMSFIMRTLGQGLTDLLPFAHLSREEAIDQLVSLLLYGITRRDQPVKGL
ncbi:MAG TPA: TetR family transcriptional regulator [Ktedonobacteraceae bacterium]|nr:TetR family transcriptional regulator [Ktedonobacteraceae bacterium]